MKLTITPYGESVEQTLGISDERADELQGYMHEAFLHSEDPTNMLQTLNEKDVNDNEFAYLMMMLGGVGAHL